MTRFLNKDITIDHILNQISRFISAFFSPILIPTYSIVLALWITPLREINENVRMASALTVLLLTALAPTLYIASMTRLGHRESLDNTDRLGRVLPTVIFMICQLGAAFYLYKVYAPAWLVMILVTGGALALVFLIANCFMHISGHMTAMGGLCALLFYLAMNQIADISLIPWIAGMVALSGLVGTARLQLARHSVAEIGVGFFLGAITMYAMMNVHLFDQRVPT